MTLNKSLFNMHINSLCSYLKQDLPESIAENDYWPYLKRYEGKRFAECCTWLKENYDNTYRFPLIADFKTAWHATHKVKNEVKKPEIIDKAEYSRDILGLAEKFRIPGSTREEKVKCRQYKLYNRMVKENKVFSYRLNKWVDRTLMNNVGGDFILPEERL